MSLTKMGLAALIIAFSTGILNAQETVWLSIRGVIERPAEFYDSGSTNGVVLAPQFMRNAQSWQPLGSMLKDANYSSLALNSSSVEEVLTAIDFLRSKGITEISLIGASAGGAAILETIEAHELPDVRAAVLLGTAYADAASALAVSKLFVIATDDWLADVAYQSFEQASEPKSLIEYPGIEHAQEIFEGESGEELEAAILDFLEQY